MKLYAEAKQYKLYHGNMLDMLEVIELNSIDSIVTDPPYGLTSIIKRFGKENSALRKNIHPTVKPVELMQYLVRLVSPKGSTILDCFCGSGSTGKATMFENRERDSNYKFIGIELTEEYLPIQQARIDYALNKYEYDFKKELEEAKELGQQNIFDFIGSD